MPQTKKAVNIDHVNLGDLYDVVVVNINTLFEIQSPIFNNHSLLFDIKLELRIIKAIEFSHVLIIYFKDFKNKRLNTMCTVIMYFYFSIVKSKQMFLSDRFAPYGDIPSRFFAVIVGTLAFKVSFVTNFMFIFWPFSVCSKSL